MMKIGCQPGDVRKRDVSWWVLVLGLAMLAGGLFCLATPQDVVVRWLAPILMPRKFVLMPDGKIVTLSPAAVGTLMYWVRACGAVLAFAGGFVVYRQGRR